MKNAIVFAKLDPAFLSNRKIVEAGRDGRDVFLHVLCANAGRGGLGWIPLSDLEPWYVARQLGITKAEAARGVELAQSAQLIAIDNDRVEVLGWDTEWARRPQTNAERQATHRARNGKRVTGNPDVVTTGQVPDRNESDESNVTSDGQRDSNGSERGEEKGESKTLSRNDSEVTDRDVAGRFIFATWRPSRSAETLEAESRAEERDVDLELERGTYRDDAIAKGKIPTTLEQADAGYRFWLRNARAPRSGDAPTPTIRLRPAGSGNGPANGSAADTDDDLPPMLSLLTPIPGDS